MKLHIISTAMLIIFISSATYSQNSLILRANTGFAIQVQTGYYFSFDIGIPICKGLEIAPTFNHASMIPDASSDYIWYNNGSLQRTIEETPVSDNEYGSTLSS